MRPLHLSIAVLVTALLAGCDPTYNWRDHVSPDGDYKVLFPAKPTSLTRPVDLDGLHLSMTMTAAEVDGATFAVGSAQAPDAVGAQAAVAAMRGALLRNIGADADAPAADAMRIEALGRGADGRPVRLSGRFAVRGAYVYQVIVLDRSGATPPEQVEQFLDSFSARVASNTGAIE